MRELNHNEVQVVAGGENCTGYAWWTIPLFAGAGGAVGNVAIAAIAYKKSYSIAQWPSIAFFYGVLSGVGATVPLLAAEFVSPYLANLPYPSFNYQGQGSASCHG